MQKALETKRLTLSYGETIIIDELNLEIPKAKLQSLSVLTVAENQLYYVH